MDISKKIKTLEFKLSKILNGGLFGAYKSKFHGSGMEFAEHKEYVFGDSLRDIDWKAYNKTNTIYVKKYEEERDLNVLFILDNSKSMEFGSQEKIKKELLVEVFYSLAMSAYSNNDNIGAYIFNDTDFSYIESKKSKENIFRILEKLEYPISNPNLSTGYLPSGIIPFPYIRARGYNLFEKNNNSKIEEILNLIYKRNVKNNLIFILTDDTEIKNEKLFKLLGRENEIIYINIFDDFENNLSDIGGFFSFTPGKDFLNVDLSDTRKIEEYKKNINIKFKYLKEFFRKNNVGYINLNTNSDVFKELILYFYKVKN